MKKEDLIAKGLTEEQAKFVMDSLDGDFVTKARFNEVNEEKNRLKDTLKERDGQLETLKKSSGDTEALQKQIADLQDANKKQQKEHEAAMKQLRLDNAVNTALAAAGARNVKAVRSLLDESKFKLTDSGDVEGLADAVKAVQKSDGYLFMEKTPATGGTQAPAQLKGFQPGASGDQKPEAKVDTTKMTYTELAAYMAANPGVKLE